MKFKKYKKDLQYTYCLGVFPTIELIKKRPNSVNKIYYSSKAEKNTGFNQIQLFCKKNKISLEQNNKFIQKIAFKENTLVIGIFNKYTDFVLNTSFHVVLVNPSNMGNLGNIIRTMVAFGVHDLVLIKPCADIFDPKVISASMGSIFYIRFSFFNSLNDYINKFENFNNLKRIFYTFYLNNESIDIRKVNFLKNFNKRGYYADNFLEKVPISFIFGNESSGLKNKDADLGIKVKIPQSDQVDSLNLHVSVSIALWELSRLIAS